MSMLQAEPLLASLPLVGQGKVRDIYRVDPDHLLFVASDRLSAFDVVLPDPIPGKGEILTKLSRFWFEKFGALVPNHMTAIDPAEVVAANEADRVRDRAMVVRDLMPLPLEAIVRGYLAGSGWREYADTGAICGIDLPPGLAESAELTAPIFTPSTKAAVGAHDENVPFATIVDRVGEETAERVRRISIALYTAARLYARERGIVIADTKLEFGLDPDGALYLIDELLTPDSSRFWPLDEYRTGISPPSFDKQYVRDYLQAAGWDKRPPAPRLPAEVIAQTTVRYREALERLMGAPR